VRSACLFLGLLHLALATYTQLSRRCSHFDVMSWMAESFPYTCSMVAWEELVTYKVYCSSMNSINISSLFHFASQFAVPFGSLLLLVYCHLRPFPYFVYEIRSHYPVMYISGQVVSSAGPRSLTERLWRFRDGLSVVCWGIRSLDKTRDVGGQW